MRMIQIIDTQLKLEMDKYEIELERIVSDPNMDINNRIITIQETISKWRVATDNYKYWRLFVSERTEQEQEQENDN